MKRVLFAIGIWAVLLAIGFAGQGLVSKPDNFLTINVDYDSVGDTTDAGDNYIAGTIGLTSTGQHFSALVGDFIIDSSVTTTHGFGLSDSCYLWVKSSNDYTTNVLSADTFNSMPCTVHVATNNDTLLLQNVYLQYRITDTTSDTAFAAKYRYRGSFVFKGN